MNTKHRFLNVIISIDIKHSLETKIKLKVKPLSNSLWVKSWWNVKKNKFKFYTINFQYHDKTIHSINSIKFIFKIKT